MDLKQRRTLRYALLTVSLTAMVGVLAWMFAVTLKASRNATAENGELLKTLAIASVALLGVTLIALTGVVLRWLRSSIGLQKPLPPSHYVDAWSEAGKRIQPQEEEPDDDDEDVDNWRGDEQT